MSETTDTRVRPGDAQTGGANLRMLHIGHPEGHPDCERLWLCGVPVRVATGYSDAGRGPRGRDVCETCARLDAELGNGPIPGS